MANVISNLGSWSTTPSSNEPNAGSDTSSVREDLQTIQAVVRKYLATATTLAAGATTDLSTAAGNLVTLTGTATTINSFGTVSAGLTYYIISNTDHTVTYNATSMKLPGGASITLASGDVLEMTSEGAGNWKCVGFQPFAGYQPKDADLTAIAALSTQAYGRSLLETASESALKALINLEIGTDVQAYDATLTAFAGGLTAANKIPYATALNTLGELDFKDEDNMASNSATALPSQQSVKAYVDTALAGVGSGWELIESWTPTATTNHVFDLREDLYSEWVLQFENLASAVGSYLRITVGYSGGTVFAGSIATVCETYPSASNSSLHGTCRIVGATTSANSHGIIIHRSIFQYNASALTLIDTAVSSYDSTAKRQYDSIKVDNGIINFTAQGSIRLYGLNRA